VPVDVANLVEFQPNEKDRGRSIVKAKES